MTKPQIILPGVPTQSEEREQATVEEAKLMVVIQRQILIMLGQTRAPRQVQLNAVLSTLAAMATHMNLQQDPDSEIFQQTQQEAFRRLFDAAASVEDFVHRGVVWKPQSLKLKTAERDGGGVTHVEAGEGVIIQ